MGLDRFQKTPCGFCFVEYYNHQDALDCMKYIGGTKLDERIIRTDLDEGFAEGRQYGYVWLPAHLQVALLILISGVAVLEVKCAMSIVTSTILVAVVMVAHMRKSLVTMSSERLV
jgi:hypothetical protein